MKNKLCIRFGKKRSHLEPLSHCSSGRSVCPLDFNSWFLGDSSLNNEGDRPNQFQWLDLMEHKKRKDSGTHNHKKVCLTGNDKFNFPCHI